MGRRDTNVRVRLQRRPYERPQPSDFGIVKEARPGTRTQRGAGPHALPVGQSVHGRADPWLLAGRRPDRVRVSRRHRWDSFECRGRAVQQPGSLGALWLNCILQPRRHSPRTATVAETLHRSRERHRFSYPELHLPIRRGHGAVDQVGDGGRKLCTETVTDGLKNASKAFLGLFEGRNIRKQLVRVAE